MSCKNENKKNVVKSGGKFNLNSISGILNIITAAFEIPREPLQILPPPLLLVGAKLRPGLSPSLIAARIISRRSEAGLPVGNVFADGPNKDEAETVIIVEEIINSLITEGKIEIVIPPGISIAGFATDPLSGTLPVVGATTTLASGEGVIR